MDVELSDLLTCPRCGPTYGLVLVPYEVEDRRVASGVLGCANCRERYPIEGGVADLRVGAVGDDPAARAATSETEGGADGAGVEPHVRLAGLMGLGEARGVVLVAGPAVARGPALSELVEGIEVVAVAEASGWSASSAGDPISRIRATTVLPFRSGSLRGVALTGRWAGLLEEGARVLGREGRLVVDPAPPDAPARLEAGGLSVVAEEGGVVVAARGP